MAAYYVFRISNRMVRPLLFQDRISNCSNVFGPEQNQTQTHLSDQLRLTSFKHKLKTYLFNVSF